MRIVQSATLGGMILALGAVGCSESKITKKNCLFQGKDMEELCCDPATGAMKAELSVPSQCSIEELSAEVQNLIRVCGIQPPAGGGMLTGLSSGVVAGLASIAENQSVARTFIGDKEGINPNEPTTSNANAGGNVVDPSFVTGNNGGGATGSGSGSNRVASGNSGGSNGSSSGSGSGSSGGSLGGISGTKRALLDPNAELGKPMEAPNSAYSGGGGAAGSGGGSSSGSGGIGGMFSGLFGAKDGGAAGSGGSNGLKFGAQSQGKNAANGAQGSADPEDYFTRINVDESLFKKVEKRYEQTTLRGALASPGSLGGLSK